MIYYIDMESPVPLLGDARAQTEPQSLPTRLMVVTHFVQKQTLERLRQNRRYEKLSLAYVDYISLLAEGDRSPGELAEQLGISKQACSKMLRELEALGLTDRRVNPQDSRSSVLSLSTDGLALLRDGVEAANGVQAQLAEAVGAGDLERLHEVLDRLCAALGVERSPRLALEDSLAARTGSRPTRLTVLLPRLSENLRQRLAAAVRAQGFTDLRPGIGQVLGVVGREGRRLQYIATLLGVSKQAVAATAAELEQQGYALRETDPQDQRQVILSLSPRGRELMQAIVASVQDVEASTRAALGEADYSFLDEAMAILYAGIAGHYDSASVLRARIQQLSKQLLDELGMTGARALAQQLMGMTRGKN